MRKLVNSRRLPVSGRVFIPSTCVALAPVGPRTTLSSLDLLSRSGNVHSGPCSDTHIRSFVSCVAHPEQLEFVLDVQHSYRMEISSVLDLPDVLMKKWCGPP